MRYKPWPVSCGITKLAQKMVNTNAPYVLLHEVKIGLLFYLEGRIKCMACKMYGSFESG